MMIHKAIAALAVSAITSTPSYAAPTTPIQGVSQYVFDRIVHFGKIALATYAGDSCTLPSLPRVATIRNTTTDIYGWILRDDETCEIIVTFRGTVSDINHVEDRNWTLGDVTGTLPSCTSCEVHGGYYVAWLSVMDQVFALLDAHTTTHPDYHVVVTGHSLGAGLASICSAHLAPTFGNGRLKTYTYGEPRSGNPAFAAFLDKHFTTDNIHSTRYFRVTHENDGIVTVPPVSMGYLHQGLELWSLDPPSPNNTYICPSEGACDEAAGGQGINAAHGTYFGVMVGTCSQDV